MAKTKDVPNLPSSSRMQMSASGDKLGGKISEHGGMTKGKNGGASSKVISGAKGKKSMKGNNPYC